MSQASPWKLISDGPHSGAFNMALDDTLLRRVSNATAQPTTYLRFYRWIRPTLSIGLSQKVAKVVNLDFCHQNKIDIVRRPTGGKAVLHDQELTYAVISNDRSIFPLNDIGATYQCIAKGLSQGLRKIGLKTEIANGEPRPHRQNSLKCQTACFALVNHFEVTCRGRKLVGSAQRRTQRGILQHGSILLEFASNLLARVIRMSGIETLESQVTCLRSCLGYLPRCEELISHVARGFAEVFNTRLDSIEFDHDILTEAEDLSQTKYTSLE